MLEAVIIDGGRHSISAIARANAVPVSTAHRQVATLVEQGYLAAAPGGRHGAGPRLLGLLHRLDEKQVVVNVAARRLDALATQVNSVVQLGTFENDMVTYRIKTGKCADGLFTKVDMQLEAYCSAIGKMLLASLPERERDAYLAGGPFVALTAHTITDPQALAHELARIGRQDYATDDEEIAQGLACAAVPIRNPSGRVLAAISVSQALTAPSIVARPLLIPMLRAVAKEIETAAFGATAESSNTIV